MSSDLRSPPADSRESSRLSRQLKTILFVLVVVIGIGTGYAYRQHHRYKHVAVHDPGKVYRAAWVDPEVMQELIARYDIRTVVNLCAPGEMGEHHWDLEREAVRNADARLLEIPMPTSFDRQGEAVQPHLDLIQNPENYPMLVHCQNGIGRTSQFLALYDMTIRHLSAEQSLAAQPKFGREHYDPSVQEFCQHAEQTIATHPNQTAISSIPAAKR